MLDSELFSLLENTGDAAFSVTEHGEIRSWNRSAELLFGYSAEQAIHRGCREVLAGIGTLGTQVCHEGCSVLACAGKKSLFPNFDLNVKTRSGDRLWVNVSTLVYKNERTGLRLLVHLAHDITERKRIEDLAEKVREFSHELARENPRVAGTGPIFRLTDQEKKILKLFAQGKTSERVGKMLGISLQTLRNHMHNINQKLRTKNRLEAVMHAIQRKLI